MAMIMMMVLIMIDDDDFVISIPYDATCSSHLTNLIFQVRNL